MLGMASRTAIGAGAKQTSTHVAVVPPRAHSTTEPVPGLFSSFSTSNIAEIMAAAVVRRFQAGQTIVRANDPGTHLFLLKTGSADFHRVTPAGKQVLITRFSPGDSFGLVSLLAKPMCYIGTAEAVRDTELYVWEHARVRHFAGKHPMLIENALRIGLEYIRLYSDRHLALVSDNAEDRLRRTLSSLGIRTGQRHPRGLELQITNERLASLADVGYYHTSRLLNKWKRIGALEKSRGKIIILRPDSMLQ
jgi:CRP-like cAMP-binding protein